MGDVVGVGGIVGVDGVFGLHRNVRTIRTNGQTASSRCCSLTFVLFFFRLCCWLLVYDPVVLVVGKSSSTTGSLSSFGRIARAVADVDACRAATLGA